MCVYLRIEVKRGTHGETGDNMRDTGLGIRLTPVEKQLLEAAARRCDKRPSTFCREVLVDLARSTLLHALEPEEEAEEK
jgi:uncharacterized protein (DUF1778 family)